jgi:hypothetical protein
LGGGFLSTAAPSLPAGFQSQPVHGFRDPSGRIAYEFSNVYGPPEAGSRGLVCQLDEGRSYWSAVGQLDDAGQDPPSRRSISYAEARRALPGHLSFAQFASELHMRRELPGLTRANRSI